MMNYVVVYPSSLEVAENVVVNESQNFGTALQILHKRSLQKFYIFSEMSAPIDKLTTK